VSGRLTQVELFVSVQVPSPPPLCGDGAETGDEQCDDGNTVSGDGCSSTCTLEAPLAACRAAIAKGVQKYHAAFLAAVQQCQLQLASGASLSVSDPADCATETAAAKKIAKAAAQARRAIAGGKRAKCTDALLAEMAACAATVDGIVAPDGATGCLRTASDGGLEATLAEIFRR
jgi:cysteine-rich repeat protein